MNFMQPIAEKTKTGTRRSAFTLVEMLVVIAIISILMTAGVIGINGMGGKGVTSGVATAESVFDEARTTAIGKGLRACVLVAKKLDNTSAEDLRRLVVAYEEVDPLTGAAKDPTNANPNWMLSSRSVLLPEQTYFTQKYSKKSQELGGDLDEISSSRIKDVKSSYAGTYAIYEFNAQGICKTPGASFIIGSGVRNGTKSGIAEPPRVTASAKKDFGGFVIWRNGSTSLFRSPEQMGEIKNLNSGDKF